MTDGQLLTVCVAASFGPYIVWLTLNAFKAVLKKDHAKVHHGRLCIELTCSKCGNRGAFIQTYQQELDKLTLTDKPTT